MHGKLLKLILGISIFSFCFFNLVNAEDFKPRLGVAPHTFELEVSRGEIFKNKIKILNQSELAIPITTRITDFTAAEETGQMLFDETSQDTSFASRFWIKIENPNFILDPGEVEEVKFSIEVPDNAEPGGHYAVVLFEPQLPSYYFKEGQPRAIPVIGVLFLISVKVEGLIEPETPLTVVEFNIPENLHLRKLENFLVGFVGLVTEAIAAEKQAFSIVETSHLSFTLRIKNNDIYHVKPKGKLLILTGSDKIAGETEITETTILPGKIREFPVEFKPELPEKLTKYLPASISNFITRNLLFGNYRASLYLTTEKSTIKENIEFFAFPWKFVLSIVFIFALTLFFLIKYKKRIKSAVLIVFRGIKIKKNS